MIKAVHPHGILYLLCSEWDTGNLEELDYSGMYEYLYSIKYKKRFAADSYPNGIPKEEFENVIMEFLPVTVEQIQTQAVLHEETRTYAWTRLGCLNYNLTTFGTFTKRAGKDAVILFLLSFFDMIENSASLCENTHIR